MPKKPRLRDAHEPNHIQRLPPKEPDVEPELDLIALLDLQSFAGERLELALREYRIKGIDLFLTDIKKTLKKKEEKDALNKYLGMCPSIERLTEHLLNEYPRSAEWFREYNEKLKKKIVVLKR